MKKIPRIQNQGSLEACQTFALCQYLNTTFGTTYNPVQVYGEVMKWLKDNDKWSRDKEPTTYDVLDWLQFKGVIYGHDHQLVGKSNIWKFIKDNLFQWITNPRSIAIAKGVCNSGGGVISCNVPQGSDINTNGVITKEQIVNNKDRSHAMFLYDYNDVSKVFVLVNSWGYNYGDKSGCILLPYELLNYCNDLTTVSFIKNKK